MASQIERIRNLEALQEKHEENEKLWRDGIEERVEWQLSAFSQRLEGVEGAQASMNTTMNGIGERLDKIITKMEKDDAVKEALNNDRKKLRLDLKDWIMILSGLVVGAGTLIPVIKALL